MQLVARIWTAMAMTALLAALLAALACAADPPPNDNTPPAQPESAKPASRTDILVSLTDDLIVPRFQSVAMAMDGLSVALHSLCADPTPATLDAARTAWRDARAPWLRSQALWFGPVMERRSRSLVDWSPVDPERIEKALADRDAITDYDVREFLSSTQRGLGAIEYVVFGDDGEILAALAPHDAIRCQYLAALGDVASAETAGVLSDWTGAGGESSGYAGYFNGTASSALLHRAAVDELVRTSVFLTRSIADMRLGKALGAAGAAPEPDAIPGGAAHNSVADLRNQTLGMQDVYRGADDGSGLGIDELVRGVSPEADARMAAAFDAALTAIDALPEPLPSSIADNPEPARQAHARLQELQRALNTEVVSLLGVTVGFADTDGDGG